MFPLAGTNFPESSSQLAAAIRGALSEVLELPSDDRVVDVEGGDFPALQRVTVNLSGAKVNIKDVPPPPVPGKTRRPGITVDRLEVLGQPISYAAGKADLKLNASGVSFDFARDTQGRPMLLLSNAREGDVRVTSGKEDVRAMLMAAASAAAKQQGITIQDLQLDLVSEGTRSIGGDARVKAKKLMMSGTVYVRGKVDIDDNLVATLSNLHCGGEGVVGSIAAGFLQGRLKQAEGKSFPLTGFSLGDVSLHDLKISVARTIQISAEFGNKTASI